MRIESRKLITAVGALLIVGCVVREEPRHRRVVVYDPPPSEPVEVVPVQPGPDYVYVQGVYVHEGDHWPGITATGGGK